MGRAPCCENNGLKKGPWTAEEDQKLIDYIQKHGHGSWRMLPKNAGLSRCGKSCRLRWTNYLRPDIKRGRFSFEEEETIIQLHSILGNKWSAIAARLPGRTDNEIKNYWNTHIRKRLLRMGIDPVTHSPRLDLLDLSTLLTNPSLYNQTQLDMSRLVNFEPLVNSELLRLASTLLSSQNQGLQQEPQFTNNSTQVQNQGLQQEPQFTNNSTQVRDSLQQFQNPIQQVPTCTTSEPEFFNVGQFQINADQWQNNNMQSNSSENFTATMAYYDNLEQLVPHFVSDNSNFYLQNNQNYAMNNNSGISTPVSSPTQLNSASTYINSSTEDERESYCSELFKFEIPELLDVSEFM